MKKRPAKKQMKVQDELNIIEEASEILTLTVQNGGERLDVFAANNSNETRSYIKKLIDGGAVLVNGACAKANQKLKTGDTVEMTFSPPVDVDITPENIPLDIVYEDKDILVINKAKGMVVHPAPGNESGTLVNAVMFHTKDLSGIGGEMRPGIVHRLDKLTSGLIVVAKNDMAHRSLAEQIKAHTAHRVYLAVVEGNLKEDCGRVDAPIGRHPVDRKKMAVVPNGREAVTNWHVVKRYGAFTLLLVRLESGRTHQIRVHMAHIKHPVACDDIYGAGDRDKLGSDGQLLHAAALALTHPRSNERMCFRAPLPDYFLAALNRLENAKTPEQLINLISEGITRLTDGEGQE